MSRIAVETQQLSVAGGRHATAAADVRTLSARLGQACERAAGAAGQPELEAALGSFSGTWTTMLGALAERIEREGTNLGAGAGAYDETDRNAMPGGR